MSRVRNKTDGSTGLPAQSGHLLKQRSRTALLPTGLLGWLVPVNIHVYSSAHHVILQILICSDTIFK